MCRQDNHRAVHRDVLSNIQPAPLAAALLQGDVAKLTGIPGIGKKTAERLVLELKEKVAKRGAELAPPDSADFIEPPDDDVKDDVLSALVNLGYKEVQVKKVLADLETGDDLSVEAVLKQALRILMR